MANPRYRYERAAESHELRILRLQPSENSESEIQCELRIMRRDSEPKYTALSTVSQPYSWGEGDQSSTDIKIKGANFEIRKALASALRRLRRETEHRDLWIDAICVIQDGYAEDKLAKKDQNAQVTNMDETYAKASEVVIWLGESTEDSRLAMQAIDSLGSQLDTCLPIEVPNAQLDFHLVNGVAPSIYIGAIGRLLLQRLWFHRLWVVQEICLGPGEMKFVCGGDEVPSWKLLYLQIHPKTMELSIQLSKVAKSDVPKSFEKGLGPPIGLVRHWFLAESKQKLLNAPKQIDRNNLRDEERKQLSEEGKMTRLKEANCTLLNNIWHFRHRDCTKLHDKVYAVLGISCDIAKSTFTVDYRKKPDEIFAEAARAIISKHQRIEILGMCFGPEELLISAETNPKRPEEKSQKPKENSTRPSWVPNLHPDQVRPFSSLTMYQHKEGMNVFTATGDSKANVTFGKDPNKLVLEGYAIGIIKDTAYEGLTESEILKTLPRAWNLAQQSRYSNKTEAFWRTLIANRGTEGRQPTTDVEGVQFDLWWKMVNDLSLRTPQNFTTVMPYQLSWINRYTHRDFFITDTGYIGLCGITRALNDVVCLLPGSQVPLVLRPQNDVYQLVAECYVHDIMYGSLWRDLEGSTAKPGNEMMQKRTFCIV